MATTADGFQVEALLVDLDGTVYFGGEPIPGAIETLEALRQAEIPFRFITNTTRRPRSAILEILHGMGIDAEVDDVVTAPVVATRWLKSRRMTSIHPMVTEATRSELAEFDFDANNPDAVVVGDLGSDFTYDVLTVAFRALMAGAELVALQKNRYWDPGDGFSLDAGPFVAALEFASSKKALVIGKPSAAFFEMAIEGFGVSILETAMVGDSLRGDVAGIQGAGGIGVLVQTGKFRPELLASEAVRPQTILGSFADVPEWLGI